LANLIAGDGDEEDTTGNSDGVDKREIADNDADGADGDEAGIIAADIDGDITEYLAGVRTFFSLEQRKMD